MPHAPQRKKTAIGRRQACGGLMSDQRQPVCFDYEEFDRWMAQSRQTLESARVDAEHEFYNWACFKAQQAAEYALKAVLYGLGSPAVGHSILMLADLLKNADISLPEDVLTDARTLDRHYIPPRYPDAYPSGSPFQFYDKPTAAGALEASKRIASLAEKVRDAAARGQG